MRIYDVERHVNTVSPAVKQYCLIAPSKQSFLAPTKENIHNSQIVVVTLVGSLVLSSIGVKPGAFTHIFIDEAAQVEECQTIMPLSLADEKTCVVLAGDHMQMGQKIYCREAREKKFDRSIVERLISYYDESSQVCS